MRRGSRGNASSALPADVLIVTGENRAGLGCARSLHRAGVPFVVISTEAPSMLAGSRSVKRHVRAPSPDHDAEGFIGFVLDVGAATGARVVLPVHDAALRVLDDHRATLSDSGIVLAAAPSSAVRNALDKTANLETARALGIPCPRQFEIRGLGDLPELIAAVGFPMVLKPPRSGVRTFDFKWLVANNEHELRELLELHCPDGHYPLFQERVQGEVVGVYCLASHGRVVTMLAHRAIRRMFGENVYREIIAVPPALGEYAEVLLGSLSWDGLATLAFFVTPGGRAVYMETNARPWGSIGGHVAAGWDFPLWAVHYHADGVLPTPPAPAIGRRACWRFADLIGILAVARGEAWQTDREGITLGRAVMDYLAAFRPGVTSDVFRLDDPLPELIEHFRWLRGTRPFRTLRTPRRTR